MAKIVVTQNGISKEYDLREISGIGFRTGEFLRYRGENLFDDHMYLVIYPTDNRRTDIYDTYNTMIDFLEEEIKDV